MPHDADVLLLLLNLDSLPCHYGCWVMCATGKNKSHDQVVGFGPEFVSLCENRGKNDPIKSKLQKELYFPHNFHRSHLYTYFPTAFTYVDVQLKEGEASTDL